MSCPRHIGLHLRAHENLCQLIDKAVRLQLPIFQCFLTVPITGHLVSVNATDAAYFSNLRDQFERMYVHISYHSNLADPVSSERFRKEVSLAKKLGFSHAIVHPGSAKWCANKEQGIEELARCLNQICQDEPDIIIVLENAAHGNFTIGGDIADFAAIMKLCDFPERIKFCIDTAHAYVYGYNIADQEQQDEFIALLDQTIGIEHVVLIHLNDTIQELGSRIDKHHVIGQGLIGAAALTRFIMHPLIAHIPVILELPVLSEEQEMEHFKQVMLWHKTPKINEERL